MKNANVTLNASSADTPIAEKKPRVRDRLIEAATKLFYQHGINNVGIDALVTEADTNKMSLYRNFKSKDDLVVEYLKEHEDEHIAEWDDETLRYADNPRAQIEAIFTCTLARGTKKDSCGCPSANAAVELRGSGHPGLGIVYGGRRSARARFRAMAKAAGAEAPDLLGDTLVLLLEGSLMTKTTFAEEEWPGANLLPLVKQILDKELGQEDSA